MVLQNRFCAKRNLPCPATAPRPVAAPPSVVALPLAAARLQVAARASVATSLSVVALPLAAARVDKQIVFLRSRRNEIGGKHLILILIGQEIQPSANFGGRGL